MTLGRCPLSIFCSRGTPPTCTRFFWGGVERERREDVQVLSRPAGRGLGGWGLGFRVYGSGFGVQGVWFRVYGSGCMVQGVWFRSRYMVQEYSGVMVRFIEGRAPPAPERRALTPNTVELIPTLGALSPRGGSAKERNAPMDRS